MRYGSKSLKDREHILNALGEGDHTAIDALHDWHQDNPGHEQEEDVEHLVEYIDPSAYNLSEAGQEARRSRTRSVHAHLTNRPVGDGDFVYADNGLGGYSNRSGFGHIGSTRVAGTQKQTWHRIDLGNRSDGPEGAPFRPEEVTHAATDYVNRKKKSEGQKSLEEIWKSL